MRGLDPELKSVRAANYVKSMRRDLWKVSEAVGVVHPSLITPDDVDILDGLSSHRTLREVYGYQPTWGSLGPELAKEVVDLDEERKAAMVSNLLVVLCADRDAQPIVNSGSLY